ncbi:regulator of G-protein signaling 19 isoform X2 [Nematostella vectensis]|uniref:regulator of G-protein signaling 19 isoform X2 n=1 Tax=Nematostella vectensis TaxID=45351 RepID=UPI0020774505|nr:regulator of G-protein signaling 19 isoform X2 [Nematostella vectensis]
MAEDKESGRKDSTWYYNFSEPNEEESNSKKSYLDIYLGGKENRESSQEFTDINTQFLVRRRERACFCRWCCCCCCDHWPGSRSRVANMEPASRYNPRPSSEEINEWGRSFERLLSSKNGIRVFHEFLKSEYSEENLLFWLAVERLKKETEPASVKNLAQTIYNDYVSTESPKEVSIDHKTRQVIDDEISQPTKETFSKAQQHVYYVMYQDCYPRFLSSSTFKTLQQECLNN